MQQSHTFTATKDPAPMQAWSQRKFAQLVASELKLAGRTFQRLRKGSDRWYTEDAPWDYAHVQAMSWQTGGIPRILAFDLHVPFLQGQADTNAAAGSHARQGGKNVDICLLHSSPDQYRSKTQRSKMVRDAVLYVALGELKGGIDPAGADEHWKTANAHLGRIRRSFADLPTMPQLFFVGNAIEASMAGEIWNQLESGELANAANLTDDRQAVALVSWLCAL